MGKGKRVVIEFWHYSRNKKLSPKYVFTVLLLECVGFIHFPDAESGILILALILIFLVSWEIYEYSRERKDILRRAVIECPRGTDASRVRHGRIVGRNGVEIPEPDWLRPEFFGAREPMPAPIFRDDFVSCTSIPTSTTSTGLPPRPMPPPGPPRPPGDRFDFEGIRPRRTLTNEDFKTLLDDDEEPTTPTVRKIRGR